MGPMLLLMIRLHVRGLQNKDNSKSLFVYNFFFGLGARQICDSTATVFINSFERNTIPFGSSRSSFPLQSSLLK